FRSCSYSHCPTGSTTQLTKPGRSLTTRIRARRKPAKLKTVKLKMAKLKTVKLKTAVPAVPDEVGDPGNPGPKHPDRRTFKQPAVRRHANAWRRQAAARVPAGSAVYAGSRGIRHG